MLKERLHIILGGKDLSRRDLVLMAVSLLVSFLIWAGFNMGQQYYSVVSVPVQASSNLDGRATMSSGATVVAARVRISGFSLLGLRGRSSRVSKTIEIDPELLNHVEGEVYSIKSELLGNYASIIFGDNVSVESFAAPAYEFRFKPESHRKVPVRANVSVSFKPQFMALGEFTTIPDSVTIYGEPLRLENISYIRTKAVSLDNLSRSAHGVVKLDAPAGLRLSTTEVGYNLDVARYVVVTKTFPIQVRNAPEDKHISVLPSQVEVSIKCVFPPATDPFEKASFYIDYADFQNSRTGNCVPVSRGLTSDVISVDFTPEVFECIEQ